MANADIRRLAMAPVESIHFCGDNVNAFVPASALTASNSTRLNIGLFRDSHKPNITVVQLT